MATQRCFFPPTDSSDRTYWNLQKHIFLVDSSIWHVFRSVLGVSRVKPPQDRENYCLIFLPWIYLRPMFFRTRLNIIAQYFIPLVGSGRVILLSGTDTACVAIVSVLCLDRTRKEIFAEHNISGTLASTLLPRTHNNPFLCSDTLFGINNVIYWQCCHGKATMSWATHVADNKIKLP
jgi:hypothetical protein